MEHREAITQIVSCVKLYPAKTFGVLPHSHAKISEQAAIEKRINQERKEKELIR